MIKVRAIEDFTLQEFDKLKNIIRKSKEQKGKLFIGDIFECDEKMADYLTGNNPVNRAVVKVIEVIPEKENTEKKITTRRRKKSVAQK